MPIPLTPHLPSSDADARERRCLLGRIAGILFLCGAATSLPAGLLLAHPGASWEVHATNALALVTGLACLVLPWRRMPAWILHVVVPLGAIEVALAVVAGGAHGSIFAWYFVLTGVYTGYAFRRRSHIAVHLAFIVLCMAASAAAVALADTDALVRVLVAGPTIVVGTMVIAWLREGMEAGRLALHELAEARRLEAETDALTGLGNRRRLLDDLGAALAPGEPARTLAVFDLDGFKAYNDRFGHPAGDGLLARLGRRLDDAAAGRGRAYRLGGDEFCVLLDRTGDDARPAIAAAVEALSAHGESFDVGSSHGRCELPLEAATPSDALQVADRRLYADKGARRGAAGQQAGDVLVSLLALRRPGVDAARAQVAGLARGTARRLGLGGEETELTVRGAELHDIGTAAIPQHILEKTTPLTDEELGFVHRHTLVGEHILNAAPALRPVARLVRASHERFDGSGYPDGLAGTAIPLGARIVAVATAYGGMRATARRGTPPLAAAAAMAELRRHAGTRFDPDVVEAFAAEIAATGSARAPVRAASPGPRFASCPRP